MAWSYKRLWFLLVEREMNRTQLRSLSGVSTSVMAHLGKNEPVTMEAIGKICEALQCRIEDVVEYVPERATNHPS